jgi:hypothetical protein
MKSLGEKAIGERALWLWSKGALNWLRLDGSKKFNSQAKVTSWSKSAKLRLQCDQDDIVGLLFFHGKLDFRSVTGALESLQGHGFIPDAMEEDASSSTTTLDEVAMPEENDPTSGLPEMKVAEAWVKHGPPPKGAGWWGRGAPIQVQQNYNARDIVDGAGLCSQGVGTHPEESCQTWATWQRKPWTIWA